MASSSPTPLSSRVPRPGSAPEQMGLHAKLAKVMEAVGYIPKGGHNAAQNYDFVRASDVADKVREQLSQLGVTFVPTDVGVIGDVELETRNGGRQQLLTLRTTWLITDSESGETLTVQSIGAGADTGDKASYKAMTGALKYALLTTFLIPTGDDPENESPERATGGQAGRREPAPAPRNARPVAAPAPPSAGAAPEPEISDEEYEGLLASVPHAGPPDDHPIREVVSHGVAPAAEKMRPGALFDRAEKSGTVDKKALSAAAKRLFGDSHWKITELTEEQVYQVAEEVGLA